MTISTTPETVEYDPTLSIPGRLLDRATATPDEVIIERRVADEWQPLTAAGFVEEVTELASGLVAWGLEPGERVAILARTSYEWTLVDFAVWFAGGVPVPIYETSSEDQIAWIGSNSGAVLAIAESDEHASRITRAGIGSIRQIVTFGGLPELAALGRGYDPELVLARARAVVADDVATIIYTSGTTGRPKGAELPHAAFLHLIRNGLGSELEVFAGAGEGRRTLLFMPLAHVFARFIEVLCVTQGGVLGHSPDTRNLVADLQSFRPTFLLAVPRVFEKVYNSASQKAGSGVKKRLFALAARTAIAYSRALADGTPSAALRIQHRVAGAVVLDKIRVVMGGQLTYAISGGAPLGERLGHFYRGMGVTILEGYGLTETTAPTTVNLPSDIRIGTVGPAFPGTSVRVGDGGEIQVHGRHVFRGYHGNPEATAEAFTEDGWFRTGDLGGLDDDGYLTITGRRKEIIITAGGKNVAPAVLEDRLRGHALVSQVVVVGEQRPFIGALVTIDPEMLPGWLANHGLPEMDVREAARHPRVQAALARAAARANRAVSRAESIRRIEVLDVDFTETNGYLTPSMKVKRELVHAGFAAVIEDLYAERGAATRAVDVPSE